MRVPVLRKASPRKPVLHSTRGTVLLVVRLALLLMLCSVTTGCTEDFDPVSLVNKPRILAIEADNPRLDINEATTLSALVVSAEPDAQFDYFWEVCPYTGPGDEGYPCVYGQIPGEVRQLLQGEGPEFTFIYPGQLQGFVDLACSQLAEAIDEIPEGQSIPDCGQGFPARARLTATDVSTGEEIVAVKTIYLFPSPEVVTTSDNENPKIASLEKVNGEAPVVDESFEVRCTIDQSSLEEFVRSGEDAVRREEILLSWYVRNGSVDNAKTFFCQDDCDNEDAQTNDVTPEESGTTTVWCVIRDGRGGIDWQQLDVEVP